MSSTIPTEREMAEKLLTGPRKIDNLLIMGLFHHAKWDTIRSKESQLQRPLTEVEICQVCDGMTSMRWDEFALQSDDTLGKLTKSDQKWLVPIVQGVISAFIYSLLLVMVLLVVKMNGIDILTALGIDPDKPKSQQQQTQPQRPANPKRN